jgi:hypothetical protein
MCLALRMAKCFPKAMLRSLSPVNVRADSHGRMQITCLVAFCSLVPAVRREQEWIAKTVARRGALGGTSSLCLLCSPYSHGPALVLCFA